MKKLFLLMVSGVMSAMVGWASGLPAGYTELEYIESTKGGKQCINTGYTAKANTKVVLDAYIPPAAEQSDAACVLFGSRTLTDWSVKAFSVQLLGVEYIRFAYNGQYVDSPTKHSFGERMTITCDKNQLTWTGRQPGSAQVTVPPLERSKSTLYIFGDNTVAKDDEKCSGPFNPSVMRLYSFKIYEGEELVHDFVPCIDEETNKAGLYDVVEDWFYPNKGSDWFRVPGGMKFIGVTRNNFWSLQPLRNGTTYCFMEDVDATGYDGYNAAEIDYGAMVEIVVPKNVRVRLTGGAADYRGAGAGIYVPYNSMLSIRGAGELFAFGGKAANGYPGGKGREAGYHDGGVNKMHSGIGGAGGGGGGGAGAGIGGKGGGGGGVEPYTSEVVGDYEDDPRKEGLKGGDGHDGSAGTSCGRVNVSGSVSVVARGGAAATDGCGGGPFSWACFDSTNHGNNWYVGYSGGGGGGGGGGMAARDIGGGGGGGGGGGSGGSGGVNWYYYTEKSHRETGDGNGGGGGRGSINGGNGASAIGTTIYWQARDYYEKAEYIRDSKHYELTCSAGGAGGEVGANGGDGTLNVNQSVVNCTGAGAYDVGQISATERIRWERNKLWRIKNGVYTEIPYETVTEDTEKLDGGKWYVVKNVVKRKPGVDVGGGGAANLVLLAYADMTVEGSFLRGPGVYLPKGCALNIFGVGSGTLTAIGDIRSAGIGGIGGVDDGAGTLTIYGGTVKAFSPVGAAIGGGLGGAGGTVIINGGTVEATAGTHIGTKERFCSAGIGGGAGGDGGTVIINGGRVEARGGTINGDYIGAGIGGGAGGDGGTVIINGGVVTAFGNGDDGLPFGAGKGGDKRGSLKFGPRMLKIDNNHYREGVAISFQESSGLRLVKAVDETGATLATSTQDGVVLALLQYVHRNVTLTFAPQDVGYRIAGTNVITVGPIDEDFVIPPGNLPKAEVAAIADPVEYLRADGSTDSATQVRQIQQANPKQDILSSGWYLATGEMTLSTLNVRGAVNLILADGATLTVNGGIRAESGNTLNIFCQKGGTGRLVVNGSMSGAVTVNGGRVTAQNDIGGPVAINGGTVMTNGRVSGTVTINGGSVKTEECESQPKNTDGKKVYCVAANVEGLKVEGLKIGGLAGYGANSIYQIDGCVYLHLPTGTYDFSISDGTTTYRYYVDVRNDQGAVVEPLNVGLFVNGVDIANGPGDGWEYDGSILSLNAALTYVLSGAAMNNEVQITTAASGATVVLSNAVVFAKGRPAFTVSNNTSLLMAGGASYLASTNGAEAVSIDGGCALTVDLAPNGIQKESTIGVFTSGDESAIVGPGSVAVNGGTLAVWADRQAVKLPESFTYEAAEVLMTGETSETMRYANTCDNKSCVFVAPGATITVKDIPHIVGFVVSNEDQELNGTVVEGGTAYRVMVGDNVSIVYAVEAGYFSRSANPLVFSGVEGDITIDAGTIEILPNLPYRAWNVATQQMEDRICSNYEVVTAETASFDSDKWYAATSAVSRGTITVNGSAHLILCDGVKLKVASAKEYEAGIAVTLGNALTIHGQANGTGELEAVGKENAAGIGGGRYGAAGAVTIDGGIVTASGGSRAAGIGGGAFGKGGDVTIHGGMVKAYGRSHGAGIGGGEEGAGGRVTIDGGTVVAINPYNAKDIGGGWQAVGADVKITGGSIQADSIENAPSNGVERVFCVTAKVEGLKGGKLKVEGLGNYGTNDVYPTYDRVYMYLPKGTYRISISDGTTTYRYHAEVNGADITVEPLTAVGFFVNGVNISEKDSGDGWQYVEEDGSLELFGIGPYVLSGVATNNEVSVKSTAESAATVVLSNAVVFASSRPAFTVSSNISLLMAGGASYLVSTNGSEAVSIDGECALTVGLAQGANGDESMIGVFNYGDESAIVGSGSSSVAVNGGTLAVWADKQSVKQLESFIYGAGEVLMVGTPETLRYATACNEEPCAIVTPGVTVTVKEIPHITDITVSNSVQEIEGTSVTDGTEYRVLPGDDVSIGYALEEGWMSKSENPLVYTEVEEDFTVDSWAIDIQPMIAYRAWNAETWQMETRMCANYTVVTAETASFESNKWYVVTSPVSHGAITISDSAHLILCDDATLTVEALTGGGSLAVYAQSENGGALVVAGEVGAALTVESGNVKAGTVTTPVKNAMGDVVHCVTCEGWEDSVDMKGLTVTGLTAYGIEKARLIEGKVYLWLPDGTHNFTLLNGTTYYDYCANVNGADITVAPRMPMEKVTPGDEAKSYATVEEAESAASRAVLIPTDEVLTALEEDAAIRTYCEMFDFVVTGGGGSWSVKAVLTPEARESVAESVSQATRQIPLAEIAALPTDGAKTVSVTNCVPGFYYSLHGAAEVRALPTTGMKYETKPCGVAGEVTFPAVKKPSDAAGFFTIDVKE